MSITIDDAFFLRDSEVYDGPHMSWFTPPGVSHTGYGVAALAYIRALQRKKIKVSYASEVPYVSVNWIQPEWYRQNPNQYIVGFTPWESTEIPDQWPHYMNQCQEIWTSSTFCADVFKASGIEPPISVVPCGIDPDVWSIVDREVPRKFRFLHVGGEAGRKNVQLVIDAFIDLFEGNLDVELVLKSHGSSLGRWTDRAGNWGGNISNHPQVTSITETFEDEYDLVKLYHDAHCMVYPSSGEGFALIPFQAMATGMPTIVTNLTSMADFAEMAMPLKATWGPGHGIHLGDMAVPDEDHLRELMKSAYENYGEHKKKAMQSARIIHCTMTWDHYADQIINILGDKLKVNS